ncbi:Uncharacterized protein Adt_33211 [Abeliophyllum distichum]|uniref:Uncharacterized protein n=1 Tax=Abeliophyllum distichum TaxID=126358 RepID=A0ABD1QVL4_9LAMI
MRIFYDFPYWSSTELKHNIDIMHVEKTICDDFLGTILDDPFKSKDTVNARRDPMQLEIKRELHLYHNRNRLMNLPHVTPCPLQTIRCFVISSDRLSFQMALLIIFRRILLLMTAALLG